MLTISIQYILCKNLGGNYYIGMKRYTVLNKPKQKSTYQFVCVIKSHLYTNRKAECIQIQ